MKDYLPILKISEFFANMSDDEILSILSCARAEVVTKDRNEYIFQLGSTTEFVGIVLSGSLLLVQEDLWGNRNVMASCLPGDTFGEPYAALQGTVLNISLVAAEPSRILMLKGSKILTTCSPACAHHNQLVRNYVSIMARKALVFYEKATLMGNRTTREKILTYLSFEAAKQGSRAFDIPYDR